MRAILPPLISDESVCIIILHLVPRNARPSREEQDVMMQRHVSMLSLGVDEVMFDPSWSPQRLRRAIDVAVTGADVSCQRMRHMLDEAEEQDVTPEEVARIIVRKNYILWEC